MTLPIRLSATGPAGWLAAADEPLPTAKLLAGTPMGRDHADFLRQDPPVRAGIWRSTPYVEAYDSYPCDEFMLILDGEVTLESDGFSDTYRRGDAFILPKGFRGIWRQPVPVLKYYVLIG